MWSHFGSILVTLWRPLGSLWGPFVVNFAPEWHPCRSLRPLVVSFGLLFGSFGYFGRIFRRFCCIFHGFKAYVPLFPWILSVFCFVWRYWRYPQFFQMILNERSARASEASRARSSSSNPRLESVIAYSFREWRSNRFRSLMLMRAPAQVYF